MYIHFKKNKIAVVTIAVFIIVFSVGIFAALAEEAVVNDNNLINSLIAIGTDANGDNILTSDEIAALTGELDLSGKNISDITGLEHAVGVTSINLSNNRIRDIRQLLSLVGTNPHTLTSLNVKNNYLIASDDSEDKNVIDQLAAAGCTVEFDPQTAILVESVTLDTNNLLLNIGQTASLTATVTPDDTNNINIVWSSSDESIATVENGNVTGHAPGTATITVSSEQNSSLTAACAVTVKYHQIETTKYVIDRSQGIIKGIPKMTALSDFLKNIHNDSSDITICDADGNPCIDTTMKTGMCIKLSVCGTEREVLKIIVAGDSNGDGTVSVTDYTLTRLDILGLKELTGVYRTASDINADGIISISDYTTIRLDILGIDPTQSTPSVPNVSDPRIRDFLNVALMQQGKPYIWSAEGPDSFDCSGYVWYCLKQVGYSIGRRTANSYSQEGSWQYVPRDQLQPGDLMFYISDSDPSRIGHIGIYIGNGYHIHASSDYKCVIICRVEGWYDRMLSHGRRVFY